MIDDAAEAGADSAGADVGGAGLCEADSADADAGGADSAGADAGGAGGWVELIAQRQAVWDDAVARQEPFVIVGDPPALSQWQRRGAAELPTLTPGETLEGLPGCPGVARGRARVVLDSSDPTALAPGDVLVAPLTDPSWTPLFVSAGAVVVDVGAALSHSIIVSRELGLPCVISATGATSRIPDGALIEVNGDTGLVTVLEG